ncbi:IscS subfamily cysteine desulfurase (plasmid) [Bacillus sp. 31A1R]|uniref:IscS subfamily cysteine desulfurase n=1 Tax=Robertmurraya mangrovi TaxID=3098077 RepID=A0ABU5IUL0_9BACI|nr:IscS subfamily cysteine desulfurase [Bacillus sp. 31A1R]MDZ5470832.1 IscS subfamily cysteine desulfurase [Bacillus sp. 31A1R]
MKYFDYAASCPLDKNAGEAYIKAATEYFGNSRSLHDIGSAANQLLESCRQEIASLLGVQKDGIYFTSGGSESNFLALHSLLSGKNKQGKHIISGVAEHSSVQSTLESLKQDGYEITLLSFDQEGFIDIEELKKEIREDTVLVTIQHVNPEIGTIQPIDEISNLCKQHSILFHSDTVQSFGKLELKNLSQQVDALSISGHKFYGPKGIGAVYLNPKLNWLPFYPGTSHEYGFRPGTLNVPAIVGMTVAAQKAYQSLNEYHEQFFQLREKLLSVLEPMAEQITFYNADCHRQLPSTFGLRLKGLEGQFVMLECNRHGYAISTGSACQTGKQSASKTMRALNIPEKEAKEFIRISFGRDTTEEDITELGHTILEIIQTHLHIVIK